MGAAERVAGDAEVAVAGESSGGMMTGACSPSPSAVVPITRRARACVAGGLASPLLDWPAPDGPAASFPSAGVEAVSLTLEGGGGSSLGGGGSSLGIRGRSGLFAGAWPLAPQLDELP